jgi:tetratricopeptide (TPR) repeat protein
MPILVRVLEKPPGIVFGTSEARDLYRSPVSPGEYRDYAEYFKEASIPKAYFAFAEYYKAVNNRKLQEAFLRDTIDSEEARWSIEDEGVTLVRRGETLIAETLPQHYPWEEKNRILLSDAYNDLGEIYARMETPGMAAEAITNFKKSIDQNPRNVEAYFNLAQVYFYKERNYELARRNYERARALNLIDRDLNYNLGLIYYYRGDFFRALSYWSDLSEEIPDNPYLSSAMGSAFLHLGTYHAALGEFLVLSEVYDGLVKNLGEIKPWRAYHKRILLESSAVNNNLGVAYQKLYEETGDSEYQKNSLLALYKAGELADIMGIDRKDSV